MDSKVCSNCEKELRTDNISKGDILDMSLVEKYGIPDLLPDFLREKYARFSKIKSRIITRII